MEIIYNKLKVKELMPNEVSLYVSFIDYVKSNMKHPNWLGDFSEDDIKKLMNNNSKIYVWLLDKRIVASGMIIPAEQDDLEKFFCSDLDYKKVIDFGPEAVHPDYVGNGLQKRILEYLTNVSIEQNYEYAISTIAPENTYSIRNFETCGFKKIGNRHFKRGDRDIYRKKLIDKTN